MSHTDIIPTLRLQIATGVAIGPGKATLLRSIGDVGSISGAARAMGMGYRHAWGLIDSMNTQFIEPLVERNKGGASGGGTQLTMLGQQVLNSYDTMERKAMAAITAEVRAFSRLLKSKPTDPAAGPKRKRNRTPR